MKIRPVGAELYNADRRTDGQNDQANCRFLQAVNTLNKRMNIVGAIF